MVTNVTRRCTRHDVVHSAKVMFTSMRSRRIPALLTRTSSRPNSSIAGCGTSRSAPASSATSSPLTIGHGGPAHGPRRPLLTPGATEAPVPSTLRCRGSFTTTSAPCRANLDRVFAADAATGTGDHDAALRTARSRPAPQRSVRGRATGACRSCRCRGAWSHVDERDLTRTLEMGEAGAAVLDQDRRPARPDGSTPG